MSIEKIGASLVNGVQALKNEAVSSQKVAQSAKNITGEIKDVFVRENKIKSMEDALEILGYKITPFEKMVVPKTMSNAEQIANYILRQMHN